MENQIYKVNERVEKYCLKCSRQLEHIIKTMTKQGKISKVSCSGCGTLSAFKSSSLILQELSAKVGTPYDRTRTYRTGQTMTHPNFGIGEVVTVLAVNTIDVLFLDRTRRLIHSRV